MGPRPCGGSNATAIRRLLWNSKIKHMRMVKAMASYPRSGLASSFGEARTHKHQSKSQRNSPKSSAQTLPKVIGYSVMIEGRSLHSRWKRKSCGT